MENKKTKFLLVIASLISAIFTLLLGYYSLSNKKSFAREHYDEIELAAKRFQLEEMQDSLFKTQERLMEFMLSEMKTDSIISGSLMEERILKIELLINRQTEILTSLRQAINPTNPEEILTIARQNDKITELKSDINKLSEVLTQQQENFEISIKHEIDSSNNSTTLILAVLIPLVLNFLYTVWKDFKRPDENRNAKNT